MLAEARKQAAKRLGVDDLDYAEKRLCEQLRTAEFGRDWFAQAIDPPGADLNGFWQYWLAIDREKNNASFKRPFRVGEVGEPSPGFGFEDVTAYGISIAPTVIDALAPSAPAPRSKPIGRPSKFRSRLEKAARAYVKRYGCPDNLEGEGSLYEKMCDQFADMPTRSWALEILKPIYDEAQALRK
jgi:hypothetical protein